MDEILSILNVTQVHVDEYVGKNPPVHDIITVNINIL